MQQAATALSKSWDQINKQGRPYAEKLVKQYRPYYASARKRAETALKSLQSETTPQSLQRKKVLLEEFWRIRQSLDLIALLQPDMIMALTGMNEVDFSGLRKQVNTAISTLQPKTKQTKSS